jgi:hypothetical protein
MTPESGKLDLETLIRTGLSDPIAIALAENLLEEAGIPFFSMDDSVAARQESGNMIGWWSIRVPKHMEAEAWAILDAVGRTK